MIHTKDIRHRDSLRNTKNVLESLNLMLNGETPATKQQPSNHAETNSQHSANSFFFQYFKRLVATVEFKSCFIDFFNCYLNMNWNNVLIF